MVLQKTAEHLGKVGKALGSAVVSPIDSLVAEISGKPRSAFLAGEVFKTPFRIAGTLAWGAMTGAAKLAWAGIRNLPIFPIWNEKREEVKAASSNKRVSLANAVDGGKRTKPPVASEERLVA